MTSLRHLRARGYVCPGVSARGWALRLAFFYFASQHTLKGHVCHGGGFCFLGQLATLRSRSAPSAWLTPKAAWLASACLVLISWTMRAPALSRWTRAHMDGSRVHSVALLLEPALAVSLAEHWSLSAAEALAVGKEVESPRSQSRFQVRA